MSDEQQLLPCPFCGGAADIYTPSFPMAADCDDIVVRCDSCDATGRPMLFDQDSHDADDLDGLTAEAIAAWNTRTPSARITGDKDWENPIEAPTAWRLMPVDPTPDMLAHGCDSNPTSWNDETDVGFPTEVAKCVWSAMVRAAPAPVASGEVGRLIEMLSNTAREEGATIFTHTAEEIGLQVMENRIEILAALSGAKVERHDVIAEVVELARRDIARTQTDFLGRMAQSLCQYEGIFDEHPDGDLPEGAREEADSNISALAGLALAQLAMLRSPDSPAATLSATAPRNAVSREAIAEAIRGADDRFGYRIRLTRLVDNEATYTLTYPDGETRTFDSHEDANEHTRARRDQLRADAILALIGGE